MLIANASTLARVRGTSLIEVLITLIVLAVGLLGLGVLQVKMQQAQVDSYQRAQAILLLNDMTERIAAHYDAAPAYVTGTTNALGVGDGLPTDCSGTAAGPSRDRCDWSSALKGSAETLTVGGAARNAGAMIDAHGCVVVKQVPNSAAGICAPGIYQV
ncbi:MAG: type IV pilus modification protein PilV, partial [Betaproteobacteria bacterium]|nr:type IV pilus modification protein PilV [Betaproteobacteria bacterium]